MGQHVQHAAQPISLGHDCAMMLKGFHLNVFDVTLMMPTLVICVVLGGLP